ncbi:hypothetical protein BH10ACT8_BH10ACT8_13100 [soil metagenome]
MRTLVRQQLSSFVRGARWLWPILTYLLVLILLTALAIRPAHAAYGFIAPMLVLTAAWFGWLVSSATEPPLFQVTMVAVGARERALGARWIAAALTTVPLFLLGVIAAEIGRQAGSSGTGLWWAGVGLHLLDTLLGAGLGVPFCQIAALFEPFLVRVPTTAWLLFTPSGVKATPRSLKV